MNNAIDKLHVLQGTLSKVIDQYPEINWYEIKEIDNFRFRVLMHAHPANPYISKPIIVLENTTNKTHRICMFITGFLQLPEIRSLDSTTQKHYAEDICQLLQHVYIDQREIYRIRSLTELRFEHVAEFLNFLLPSDLRNPKNNIKQTQNGKIIRNCKVRTVESKESRIKRFPKYLVDEIGEEMKHMSSTHFSTNQIRVNGKSITILQTPIKDYLEIGTAKRIERFRINDKDSILKKLTGIPTKLVIPFLITAFRTRADLVLALYFGIFGGLRAGEICSLRWHDIHYFDQESIRGSKGIFVNIEPNVSKSQLQLESYLEKHVNTEYRKSLGLDERPKKTRSQRIFNVKGLLPILLKRHEQETAHILETYHNGRKPRADDPYFFNSLGQPLQYHALNKAFEQIKKQFIFQQESLGNVNLAANLQKTRFGFHITRGTFTNEILKSTNDVFLTQLLRGDDTLIGMLPYLRGSFMTPLLEDIFRSIDEHISDIDMNSFYC